MDGVVYSGVLHGKVMERNKNVNVGHVVPMESRQVDDQPLLA